jgi:hypothetical protein
MVNAFTRSAAAPEAVDDNLYFSPRGAARSVWVWNGVRHVGYAAYRAATGLDAHSPPFADPRFAATGTPPDLVPLPGSPALGAGRDLGPAVLGNFDFAGNPRISAGGVDLGAYQR